MNLRKFFTSRSTTNQFIASLTVNIITLSHGCVVGWLSPFLPYLKSESTHLLSGPIGVDDVSWIGSLMAVGGAIGVISFGRITEKLGKKNAMFLLVIPHVMCWGLILLSTQAYHLYIARCLAGITGGGTLRIIPLYVSEISEDNVRGMLGSFLMFGFSLGVLLIFILGNYFSFFTVPIIILSLPMIFTVSLIFLYDTPQSLLSRKKNEKAFNAMKFFRTCDQSEECVEKVRAEFTLLQKSSELKNDKKVELSFFFEKSALKGMLIGLFLMFLNQFSGTLVIITYTADIFKKSGSSLNPNESSIIVAFIQLFGVYVSTICVDRFGRKILLSISTLGSAIFLFVLASYSFFDHKGFDVSNYEWIPIFSLSFVIFLASLGIVSLPFIIITELLPDKVRNAVCTVCMTWLTILAFSVLKIFPVFVEAFELHGCMWFFSGVCFLGSLVSMFVIPETKGKNFLQN